MTKTEAAPGGRDHDQLEAEMNAELPPECFPKLVGNALITSDGEALGPIGFIDKLRYRCGILTLEDLQAVYRSGL